MQHHCPVFSGYWFVIPIRAFAILPKGVQQIEHIVVIAPIEGIPIQTSIEPHVPSIHERINGMGSVEPAIERCEICTRCLEYTLFARPLDVAVKLFLLERGVGYIMGQMHLADLPPTRASADRASSPRTPQAADEQIQFVEGGTRGAAPKAF